VFYELGIGGAADTNIAIQLYKQGALRGLQPAIHRCAALGISLTSAPCSQSVPCSQQQQ